jgi:hypothetical protein
MKTALLFIEEETLKVAYGQTLKFIPFKDLKLSHNVKFFEQLFQQANVVIVDKVVPFSREEFDTWSADAQVEIAPAKVPEPVKEPVKPKEPVTTKAMAEIVNDAQDDQRILFRSLDETTIVIDDLLSTENIPNMPGVKKSIAVFPERAVDLTQIPMENLKKSTCLKRLIREGKLIPCTPAEAAELEAIYQKKEKISAKVTGLPKVLEGSVDDFLSKTGKAGVSGHDGETINVTDEEEAPVTKVTEVEGVTLSPDSGKEERTKVQLAQRPKPTNINMEPRGIKRKE